MKFYTYSVSYFIMIVIVMCLVYFMEYVPLFNTMVLYACIFMLITYSVLFTADVMAFIYFIRMANNYTNILNSYYYIKKSLF